MMRVQDLLIALESFPLDAELHLGSYGYEGEYVVLDIDLGSGETQTIAEHDFGDDKGTIVREK